MKDRKLRENVRLFGNDETIDMVHLYHGLASLDGFVEYFLFVVFTFSFSFFKYILCVCDSGHIGMVSNNYTHAISLALNSC